jgi:alkyldihydroxyacetonephosphate synthase
MTHRLQLTPPTAPLPLGTGAPTPGISLAGDPAEAASRFGLESPLPDGFVEILGATGVEVDVTPAVLAEHSRDWWPIGLVWATEGQVPALAGAVARPTDVDGVVAVVRACAAHGVPLTVTGGRSGVLGASVPLLGGVALDMCGLAGISAVDATSGIVSVLPGTFGDVFEDDLRRSHHLTVGHWPQSMALSTVGGWVACRGAGQYSTRYGKIEDLVVGLDIVLADGTLIHTGGAPRAAQGPDLTQLFVGSEGTLGIIVGVHLRARPLPAAEGRAAYSFTTFDGALDAMRRTVQRGATPAVLRLYDATEADRGFGTGDVALLLALDEGDPAIVEATLGVLDEEAIAQGATAADVALVERWMQRRNNVAELEDLVGKGFVVDTMEISAPWSVLGDLARNVVEALQGVEGTLVASTHQSHSYLDGGCLYFTFAGGVEPAERTAYHARAWEVATRTVLEGGGSLSHHHGVGIGRAPFMDQALGGGFAVLQAIKSALDPTGLLNPGGLGLGPVPRETDVAPTDRAPNRRAG